MISVHFFHDYGLDAITKTAMLGVGQFNSTTNMRFIYTTLPKVEKGTIFFLKGNWNSIKNQIT